MGGCLIRFQVIASFVLIISSKVFNNLAPIFLATSVNMITNGQMADTYGWIVGYAVLKFCAELFYTLREITFANVSASSEVYIAHKVYNHVQNLSLGYHLSRETGKVIRICSRGSHSFSQILRYSLFTLFPMMLDITIVLIVVTILFPYYFLLIILTIIVIYMVATFMITEWRAKYFKAMNIADNNYVQKATDALLNFETVKFFNAEGHEAQRFNGALLNYKAKNI